MPAAAWLEHLALALGLGLLIGVQRGWAARADGSGARVAGIRTFGLLGLSGGVGGLIWQSSPAVALILIGGTAAAPLIGYYQVMRRGGSVSSTASQVGMLTIAVGFLSATGQGALAGAIAAVTTLVLSSRDQLHGWVARLTGAEVAAIARFALIALAILPFLPNAAYGPLDAWNPRQLWLVVVLVCGFSFLGYAANKRFGATRGTLATAAAGAMVSSTAVTAGLATRLRKGEGDAWLLTAGVAVASAVMFVRVMMLAAAIAPIALSMLMVAALPAAVASAIAALLCMRRAGGAAASDEAAVAVRNPFELRPALTLMLLVMVLTLAARWVLREFGQAGVATVLAFSGIVDVDSAIITMGGLPAGTMEPATAGIVLAVPIMLNSLFKAGIAIGVGGWRAGAPAAAVLTVSVAVGVLSVVVAGLGRGVPAFF